MLRTSVLIAVLAACGHDPSPASPDAAHGSDSGPAIDAAIPPGPNLVTLQVLGDPDLVVYRDGHGPWLTPTQNSQDQYELHVTDDYQVVVACSYTTSLVGNIDSEQMNATFDDGATPFMFCTSGDLGSSTPVIVSGQMLQAGTVTMGVVKSGTTAPWSFELGVAPAFHDLIAVGPTKMLVRRDLSVTTAMTVPTVDTDTDGSALTTGTIAVTGAVAGDVVTTEVEMFTANEYATISSSTTNAIKIPPASLVTTSDFVELSVRAEDSAHTHNRSFYGETSVTSVALPPVLTGASFTAATPVVVHWTSLPSYTGVTFDVFGGTSASFLGQTVRASQSWIAKTNATSIAFATDAKGYNAAWNIDPAQAFAFFDVTNATANGSTTTGIENSVEAASQIARVQRAAHRARIAASGNRTHRDL